MTSDGFLLGSRRPGMIDLDRPTIVVREPGERPLCVFVCDACGERHRVFANSVRGGRATCGPGSMPCRRCHPAETTT